MGRARRRAPLTFSGSSAQESPARAWLATALLLALGCRQPTQGPPAPPPDLETSQRAVAVLEPGFQEATVITNLEKPTAVRFAADGRVFVAEKGGRILVYDNLSDTSATVFATLATNVHDFWDRGLLGIALHPQFPAQPYLYVLYSLDAPIGGQPPVWNDECPTPPGATADGCVIGARLSRLLASGNSSAGETVLVEGWGQQFPSHSIGNLGFGADGALYVSSGDGAGFNFVDYGQRGMPKNPLGDPPVAIGAMQTPPMAQGGSLRSQSLRRPNGPVLLNGAVLRVDPMTGAALPSNPLFSNPDANARRIVAYGLRNPYRFAVRPGTNELWIGEVGFNTWEEINRIPDGADATVENFGWPCYEGKVKQGGYDGANLALCETLYAAPGAATPPHFSYDHGGKVAVGDDCKTGSSAITALAFYTGDKYPPKYKNALFFGDYSRQCAWAMLAGADGIPDPNKVERFGTGVARPVDLQMGPDGNLYYVDVVAGEVRRITYLLPRAIATATPTAGAPPLVVTFDGSGSTKPLADDTLTFAWDLDGDGEYDDASEDKPSTVYKTAGTVRARLRITDQRGVSVLSDPLVITVSELAMPSAPPVPVIDAPAASAGWKVGDSIAFSGRATDAEDGALPASALTWMLVMQHCPAGCHAHVVQSFTGVAAGSFVTPDHEYPAHLELVLIATDSSGIRRTTSVRLDPTTIFVTIKTEPPGLQASLGGESAKAPFGRALIVGGRSSLVAPEVQTLGTVPYVFIGWSNGQAASHDVGPLTGHQSFVATYRAAGLTAQYFDAGSETTAKVTRVDPEIDFDWGRGSPDPAVADEFRARWNGFVVPHTTGLYTLAADSDDGIRVWANGFLMIDAWQPHSVRRDTASFVFPMIAGQRTRLRIEFFDEQVDAVAKLYWSGPGQPFEAIPVSRLIPACLAGTCPTGLACVNDECVAACPAACETTQRCEGGVCVDACKDLSCDGGKCVAGACVPRCTGVTCMTGFTCEPATGTCESACRMVTCPAGQACAAGMCQPACVVNGCESNERCNPSSGLCENKCLGVTCAAGFACAPMTGTCIDKCQTLACPGQACAAGECRPTCTVKGCPITDLCNASTGECQAKCAMITCAPGATCVPESGECQGGNQGGAGGSGATAGTGGGTGGSGATAGTGAGQGGNGQAGNGGNGGGQSGDGGTSGATGGLGGASGTAGNEDAATPSSEPGVDAPAAGGGTTGSEADAAPLADANAGGHAGPDAALGARDAPSAIARGAEGCGCDLGAAREQKDSGGAAGAAGLLFLGLSISGWTRRRRRRPGRQR